MAYCQMMQSYLTIANYDGSLTLEQKEKIQYFIDSLSYDEYHHL